MKKMNKKGFTIVELVIVIAVIGILATVLIPTFGTVITNAQNESFRLAARNTFVEYTAEKPEEISGDFIYVDGKNVAAIKDGKLIEDTDEKGNKVVKIYTGETAEAAVAAALAAIADDGKDATTDAGAQGDVAKGNLYKVTVTNTTPTPAG